MIPQFPEFKKLELSDKDEVNSYIDRFPPYSDFNFAGTWSWDVRDGMQVSILNNNYVIRFIDYLTGEPFYTFLGTNEVNDTAKKLLDLSIKEGLKPELRLIPEHSIEGIDKEIFNIQEDRDNFDYIYSLEELKDMKGGKFESHRGMANRFFRNNPNAKIAELDALDYKIHEELIGLSKKWIVNKNDSIENIENHHEIIVLKKFLLNPKCFHISIMGVYIDNVLCAFSLDEIKDDEYVISHLTKADITLKGINSYIMKESANFLINKYQKKYFNFEQDLGLEKLKYTKKSFAPTFFLKKMVITYISK